MKYVFNVKEISYGSIEVDADNIAEAKEKAGFEYSFGNTCWKNSDYEITPSEEKYRGDAR